MEEVFPYFFIVLLSMELGEKRRIRSLFMFNISLKFPLNPLFLVFSILCTAEQRLCSTLHRATAQHCGSDLCGLQHKEKQCQ